MKDFNHPNVLNLIGVSLINNSPSLLLPLMTYGDLRDFVKSDKHKPSVRELLNYSIQVARGISKN